MSLIQPTLEPKTKSDRKLTLKLPREVKRTRQLKWYSSPRTLLRSILLLDDTPQSIALGTTVGIFIGMTPTVGVQMILVMLFAFLVSPVFRFNRIAALVTVYISNPLTLVPLYWFNYKIGTLFFDGDLTREKFSRIMTYNSFDQWWDTVVTLAVDVGKPLMVGSLLVATVCAAITFPTMYWLVRRFHRKQSV